MMQRELLRLATSLAADRTGQPRWVARSRSVSTAYYALFHALADCCGRELIGARRPWPAFRHVYRSLDHGQARRVFMAVLKDTTFSDPARSLAEFFIELQSERHSADYDPAYRITSSELTDLIGAVRNAIDRLPALPPAERTLLAAKLIGRTRG